MLNSVMGLLCSPHAPGHIEPESARRPMSDLYGSGSADRSGYRYLREGDLKRERDQRSSRASSAVLSAPNRGRTVYPASRD